MVFSTLVVYMIEHYDLHLALAWELFLFDIKLILLVCKVEQTQKLNYLILVLINAKCNQFHGHSTDTICLTPNHNLYLF